MILVLFAISFSCRKHESITLPGKQTLYICYSEALRTLLINSTEIKLRNMVVAIQILWSKNRCTKWQRGNLVNGCEGNFGTAEKLDIFLDLLDLFYHGKRVVKGAIGSHKKESLLILFQNWLVILNNITSWLNMVW